ncbi:hypothetical protein [Streptomyces sp. NPDC015130]|uniref:hypothetical protein n=1 Tax=Streptomyces sp. NPDC015130 TaxID=3364940 RepID=UPI0036FE8B8A
MVDLFRYIEHDFAVPARTDAIDATNQSTFQQDLEEAAGGGGGGADAGPDSAVDDPPPSPAAQVRALAEKFLSERFSSPTADPTKLGQKLGGLEAALEQLPTVNTQKVQQLVQDVFGAPVAQVVAGAAFKSDLELLQNAVVAVKLATGYAAVDTATVVRQLRAASFLRHLATPASASASPSGSVSAAAPPGGSAAPAAPNPPPDKLNREEVRRLLARPLRIPPGPLAAVAHPSAEGRTVRASEEGAAAETAARHERTHTLRRERDRLQAAYDKLLAVRPEELEVTASEPPPPQAVATATDSGGVAVEEGRSEIGDSAAVAAGPSTILLAETARRRFGEDERAAMAKLDVKVDRTAVPVALDRIGQRLVSLNEELLPEEAPTTAKVYRVGGQLFAETTPVVPTAEVDQARAPDFSKAVTRPAGVGNLFVVRQETVGYRAGEISHIENVLEHEQLRRWTRRSESSEIIETEETLTSQTDERDQQSTQRNELAAETQRESGRQSSTSGDGMTSSDYGRLVENNKSNFAQSVVARSVERRTSEVRRQRVSRESRSYVERVGHVLDNHQGVEKIRGIYQWVDKVYNLRTLNYGKRLMYDVVVPEPAAVLVQALKDAAKPEHFQLVKPLDPGLYPDQINASNYMWYATQYGVTGSVTPPPAVYAKTISQTQVIEGSKKVAAYGGESHVAQQASFKLPVPEGYKAVAGYVQTTNMDYLAPPPGAALEVVVGESIHRRVQESGGGNPFLNAPFTMAGETGEVPVGVRSFAQVVSVAYAVALVCQRTDEAYAQWQLKTHATIVGGYQRKLAEYEEKLARYVAATRAQLAAAGGLGHDPAVTLQELKRAFVFLLLGEHPQTWLPTPAPAPAPPGAALPDPLAVREWGSVVAFFERAFEWENLMHTCYPYYWGRPPRWQELLLTQDADPQFEAFLKAGAARVVVPVRPGFEAALAHFHETGDVWMGEEIPDMYGDHYLSIIEEIKAANRAPGEEVCVEQWEVALPTTLVLLKEDATLPAWPATTCGPES